MSLKFCSPLTFINRSNVNNNYYNNMPDTNIVQLGFENLKNMQVNMGDPIHCKSCKAVLSHVSKLYSAADFAKYLQQQQQKQKQKRSKKPPMQSPFNFNVQQEQKADQSISAPVIQADKMENMEEEEKHVQQQPQQQEVPIIKEEEAPEQQEMQENELMWVCEFCGGRNKLRVEREEIPKTEDQVYIVQSSDQIIQSKQSESDISVVFCIDNSGSMSVTQQIKGKFEFKHSFSAEEMDMLKQFIEPGFENQNYFQQFNNNFQYNQNQQYSTHNSTWVSRKQCVLAAIQSQLEDLKKLHPHRQVGLVTFNSDVVLLGDGSCPEPLVLTGDKLTKFDVLRDQAHAASSKLMTQPISVASQKLIDRFASFQERGQTALGPALLAAVALAADGKPGSVVVLCTDGLANVGLGALDCAQELLALAAEKEKALKEEAENQGDEAAQQQRLQKQQQWKEREEMLLLQEQQSKAFYQQLEDLAKEKSVQINVVSIKGEGCKLDVIGKLAEATNGTVTRVNPEDISKDFSNIFKEDIVATKVDVEIQLHRACKFRNIDLQDDVLEQDGSICRRAIGIATSNTRVTFEYTNKTPFELHQQFQQEEKDQLKKQQQQQQQQQQQTTAEDLQKQQQQQQIALLEELEELEELPFQVRFYYTTPEGHRALRVVSRMHKVTDNQQMAEQLCQTNVIHSRINQKTAKLFSQGLERESKTYNTTWEHYIMSNNSLQSNDQQVHENEQFLQKNKRVKQSLRNTQMQTMQQQQIQQCTNQSPNYQNISIKSAPNAPQRFQTFSNSDNTFQNQNPPIFMQQQQQQLQQPQSLFGQPPNQFNCNMQMPQSYQSPVCSEKFQQPMPKLKKKYMPEDSVIKEQLNEDTVKVSKIEPTNEDDGQVQNFNNNNMSLNQQEQYLKPVIVENQVDQQLQLQQLNPFDQNPFVNQQQNLPKSEALQQPQSNELQQQQPQQLLPAKEEEELFSGSDDDDQKDNDKDHEVLFKCIQDKF